jgi:CMP-N,N'-diacetyllegionaminic acid synthase
MIVDHKFLAIIPARKGSKGITNKNMQIIGGKPMIQFTMEAALKSKRLNNIILSTDNQNILNLGEKIGIPAPFKRPASLSTDNARISDVIIHTLDWYKSTYHTLPENIVLLQPTSPFRDFLDIDQAIKIFVKSPKKTLVSATEPSQHPGDFLIKDLDGKFKKLEVNLNSSNSSGRQAYSKTIFIDGGIYIANTNMFLSTNEMIGNDPEIMMIHKSHAIDIDTIFDLKIARAIYNSKEF